MEILLMFVAGIIVFIIALIAIFKGVIHRIKTPTDEFKEKISKLEKRVDATLSLPEMVLNSL